MAKLREEDRRAVDLLLDRAAAGPGGGNGNGNGQGDGNGNGHRGAMTSAGFTQMAGPDHRGVAAVQKVLSVLEMLPAEEPPADLTVRTLRRLDAATAEGPGALRPPQHVMPGAQMPHA